MGRRPSLSMVALGRFRSPSNDGPLDAVSAQQDPSCEAALVGDLFQCGRFGARA